MNLQKRRNLLFRNPFFPISMNGKNFRSRIIIHTYGTGFTVNRKEQALKTVGFLYKTPFVFKVLPTLLTVSLNSGGTLL